MATDSNEACTDDSGLGSNQLLDTNPSEKIQYTFTPKDYEPAKGYRLLSYIWDAFGKAPEERQFVLRLDFFMFIYSLISYIIKIIDQNNISNAFVSGMQTDLKLYGQQRNLFTTFFNMGYLAGSLPGQIIITSGVRPSYYIPACELLWATFVMCIAACNSATPIYGLRFLEGLAESAIFPSFNLVIGSWYTPSELGKRMCLFEMSGQAASMFSGYIQAGVYDSMNGRYGIAGWRWLFIIDGIISFPVAIAGFFQVPDFPTDTRAWYLKEHHRDYAVQRMAIIGRKPVERLTLKRFCKIFTSWRPYLFLLPYNMIGFASYTGYFNLWLQSLKKYSVAQLNIIPTGGNAIGLVMSYLVANLSDFTRTRWPWMVFAATFSLVGSIILEIWNQYPGKVNNQAVMFAQMIGFASSPHQPLCIAWMAESFQDSATTRGLVLGFGNTINYAMNAWLPLVLFPTPEAPHYKYGYQAAIGFCCGDYLSIAAFWYAVRWDRKRRGMVLNEYGLAVERDDVYEGTVETQNLEILKKSGPTATASAL
ncbi:major facilitator superfamily domain-containing protein [Lipomyces kononenkoae]|uniref:Major facilitator superfamily domain-containing protein n=1 Tax=Lipomyces kononenkoae TaxID=34357 RepID=A0ACC3SZA4_LIPKO